jgi:hypothetical protein
MSKSIRTPVKARNLCPYFQARQTLHRPCAGSDRSTCGRSICPRSICACPICACARSAYAYPSRAGSNCADETLYPDQSGVQRGWLRSRWRQYGRWDHSGLHSTCYGRYSTTEASHQALATNRSPGRGRLQKSESKLWHGRRSKSTTKRTTGKSVRHDGSPQQVKGALRDLTTSPGTPFGKPGLVALQCWRRVQLASDKGQPIQPLAAVVDD